MKRPSPRNAQGHAELRARTSAVATSARRREARAPMRASDARTRDAAARAQLTRLNTTTTNNWCKPS
eukprot:14874927-Alexandrium_andersonii.AAC.1